MIKYTIYYMNNIVYLPLHYGRAPKWLFNRMVRLGRSIIKTVVDEFGTDELIKRLSDPYWFQALGCSLGYDWHSSGLTTVLTGVLSEILKENDYGIYIVGGKGKKAITIPKQIDGIYEKTGLDKVYKLVKISRLAAKTDTVLLQDGYNIYHQAIIFNEKIKWSLIQQGMNIDIRYARRYHWNSEKPVTKYVNEPHIGILVDRIEDNIVNLTDRKSIEAKKTMIDIIQENRIHRDIEKLYEKIRFGLYRWIPSYIVDNDKINVLILPKKINWEVARKIYESKPTTIPEFLNVKGVNRNIVRALALISTLLYGNEIAWKDTIKYTFTLGGKDGVPYFVDRKTYDRVINFFKDIIEGSELDRKDKIDSLKRLAEMDITTY